MWIVQKEWWDCIRVRQSIHLTRLWGACCFSRKIVLLQIVSDFNCSGDLKAQRLINLLGTHMTRLPWRSLSWHNAGGGRRTQKRQDKSKRGNGTLGKNKMGRENWWISFIFWDFANQNPLENLNKIKNSWIILTSHMKFYQTSASSNWK